MRILILSHFYPPHVVGGYEQNVQDLNHALQARGHDTYVLTSRYGLDAPDYQPGVARILHLDSDVQNYRPTGLLGQKRRLQWNLEQTEKVIREFKPDIAFIQIWWNLSRGVPWTVEQLMPGRVVYYNASPWVYPPDTREPYWRDNGRTPLGKLFKGVVGPFALRAIARERERFPLSFGKVLCVSEATRALVAHELGRDPASLPVVHNGVELDQFYPRPDWQTTPCRGGLSLLYAGTVGYHKGVHTAVEALAHLADNGRPVTLTIVGSGNEEYEASLRRTIEKEGLGDRVTFHGRVPREEMPELMRRFDVLLLPSIWEEPLARVMQEAMATGLLVIGTNTGGTGELLIDGQTGLVFEPGDPAALARAIEEARADPAYAHRLAAEGRRRVVEHFGLDRMIDEIEQQLLDTLNQTPSL